MIIFMWEFDNLMLMEFLEDQIRVFNENAIETLEMVGKIGAFSIDSVFWIFMLNSM